MEVQDRKVLVFEVQVEMEEMAVIHFSVMMELLEQDVDLAVQEVLAAHPFQEELVVLEI